MARPSYPRHSGPRPPALPPVARTVGQVVAEALQLYGQRFWHALALGLPVAVADPLAFDRSWAGRVLVLAALAPVFSLAYARACTLESGERPGWRTWATAAGLGTVVFVPAAGLYYLFFMVAWLGALGWVVPVVMHEGAGVRDAFPRALRLARADPVHAVGGIAALVLLYGLTRNALAWLLREQADNTVRVSVFLADLVISPVIFLGCAILYRDLVARVGTTRDDRQRARLEAMGRTAE